MTWSVQTHGRLRRGDIVGAEGSVGKTKKGELSLFATNVVLLAPCLHMLPSDKGGGLTDPEVLAVHRVRANSFLADPVPPQVPRPAVQRADRPADL